MDAIRTRKRDRTNGNCFPVNIDVLPIYRCRYAGWDTYNRSLAAIGTWVSQNEGPITEDWSFDDVCDLLNVNPVHRTYMRGHAAIKKAGILEIVLGAGLEDSAASLSGRHPAELKDGAFYLALREEMKRAHACARQTQPQGVR